MSLVEKIKQSAKTPLEIETYIQAWRAIFRRGAMGNQRDYAEARDTRHFIEQERWLPEKNVLKILEDYTIIEKQKIQELLNNYPVLDENFFWGQFKKDVEEWRKKFVEVLKS